MSAERVGQSRVTEFGFGGFGVSKTIAQIHDRADGRMELLAGPCAASQKCEFPGKRSIDHLQKGGEEMLQAAHRWVVEGISVAAATLLGEELVDGSAVRPARPCARVDGEHRHKELERRLGQCQEMAGFPHALFGPPCLIRSSEAEGERVRERSN